MDAVTLLMIAVIVLSNAAGDVLITRGMKKMGEVSSFHPYHLFQLGRRVLHNRDFLMGVFCLAISFFAFISVLAWAEMSFVVPATSVVYVVTVLGAKFFLKEQIDKRRWAGTFLVCVGVVLICLP